MLLPVLRPHRDGGGGHSVLPNLSGRKFPTRNREAAKFRPQVLDRATRIHQGPKCHVAADAGKTVKISQFHRKKPPTGGTSSRNCRSVGFQLILSAAKLSVKLPSRRSLNEPNLGWFRRDYATWHRVALGLATCY